MNGHLEQNLQQRQRGWIQVRDECLRGGERRVVPVFLNEVCETSAPQPRSPLAVPIFRRGRRPARLAVAVLADHFQSPPHRSCARASSLSSFAMGRARGRRSTRRVVDDVLDRLVRRQRRVQRRRAPAHARGFRASHRRRRGGEFRSSVRRAESPRASRRRRGVGRRARERSPAPRLDVNLEFGLRVDDARVARLARCGTLRRVNLNAAQDVGDVAVAAIAANNPNLREMSLYWNVRVTDTAVVHLCAACPRLERVNLSGCKRLTDASRAPSPRFRTSPASTSLDAPSRTTG